MIFVIGLWTFLRALSLGSAAIALENVALRHQLAVLQRSVRRPRLSRWDRILWVWLSRLWTTWRSSLVIVQPATVLAWHRPRPTPCLSWLRGRALNGLHLE
jgi:putative transposase